MKTFEEYLVEAADLGITVHTLTVKQRTFTGFNEAREPVLDPLCFYVHPTDRDGDTRDYQVLGNQLAQDPGVTYADDVPINRS